MTKPKINIDIRDAKPPQAEHKAFALERVGGFWCMTTITYAGDKLVSIERTEPNIKQVALNNTKIANANYWMKLG